MPTTTLLAVGQCGNQIAERVLEMAVLTGGGGFARAGRPSCVLVDSEPRCVTRSSAAAVVRAEHRLYNASGRGNNWAAGYHWNEAGGADARLDRCRRTAPCMRDDLVGRALEAVRREAERADTFRGVVLLHSVGGGTGSGLGSRLLEELRDAEWHSATAPVLSACVLPSGHVGPAPMQWYNTCLTLSTVQRCADAALLFDNDALVVAAAARGGADAADASGSGRGRAARRSTPQQTPTMRELNSIVAAAVAGAMLPIGTAGSAPPLSCAEIVALCSACPRARFARARTLCTAPTREWNSLARGLSSLLPAAASEPRRHRTLAAHAVLRGCARGAAGTWEVERPAARGGARSGSGSGGGGGGDPVAAAAIVHAALPSRRSGGDAELEAHRFRATACHRPLRGGGGPERRGGGKAARSKAARSKAASKTASKTASRTQAQRPRSMTVVVQTTATAEPLERCAAKASDQLAVGAYVHWLERWGCERLTLESAIEDVYEAVEALNDLRG